MTATAARRVDPATGATAIGAYLGGRAASLVGDQIYFVAVAWLAVRAGGAGGVALVLFASGVPRALLMLGGGVVVDRVGAWRVMVSSDAARAVVCGALGLYLLRGTAGIPLLAAVGALFGVADAFFYPADGSALPRLVTGDSLSRYNGGYQFVQQIALLVGAPIGGLIVATVRSDAAFLVDAGTFVVSLVSLTALRRPLGEVGGDRGRDGGHGRVDDGDEAGPRPGWWASMGEGLRYVRTTPLLLGVVVVALLTDLAFAGPANVGFAVLAHRRGWGAGGLGGLLGGLGAGALIGAAALVAWKPRRPGVVAMVTTILQGVGIAGTALVASRDVAIALAGLAGVGVSVTGALLLSIVQRNVDPGMLGRAMSVVALSGVSLVPVAYALNGLGDRVVGLVPVFCAAGALEIVAAVIGLGFAPLRRSRLGP
jgi:MFS family permease